MTNPPVKAAAGPTAIRHETAIGRFGTTLLTSPILGPGAALSAWVNLSAPLLARAGGRPVAPVARAPQIRPISPQTRRKFERILNRLRMILSDLHKVRADDQYKELRAGTDKAMRDPNVPEIQNISPHLRGDRDYVLWFFMDNLKDIHTLFNLGATKEAQAKLVALLEVSAALRAVSPGNLYQLNRLLFPLVFSKTTAPALTIKKHYLPSFLANFARGRRLAMTEDYFPFSPEEREAWEAIARKGTELISKLSKGPLSEEQVVRALTDVGFPTNRFLWNQMTEETVKNELYSVYSPEDLTGLEDTLGKPGFLYARDGATRSHLAYSYMLFHAEQRGLIDVPYQAGTGLLPYSVLRSTQLKYLIHDFLAHHPALEEKERQNESPYLRSTKEIVDAWAKSVSKSITVSPGAILDAWRRKEKYGQDIKLTPVNFGRKPLPPVQKGDDIRWAANGSKTFTSPPPELVHVLGRLGRLPKGPALSIGCGDGREPLHLAWRGRKKGPQFTQVDALDYSYVAIDRLKNVNKRVPNTVPVRAIREDAVSYRYPRNTYSFIAAINLVEYLPQKSRSGFLKRAAHSLKKGGEFFVVIDLARGEQYRDLSSHPKVDLKGTTTHVPIIQGVSVPKHFHPRAEIDKLLQRAGLTKNRSFDVKIEEHAFGEEGSKPFDCVLIRIRRR